MSKTPWFFSCFSGIYLAMLLGEQSFPDRRRDVWSRRNVTVYLVHFVNQLGALLLAVFLFLWSELRDKRKRTGLTIEQAAERCGVDPSTYARWERGVQWPHPRNRQTLMEVSDPYEDVWYAENTWVPDAWLPPSYWNG